MRLVVHLLILTLIHFVLSMYLGSWSCILLVFFWVVFFRAERWSVFWPILSIMISSFCMILWKDIPNQHILSTKMAMVMGMGKNYPLFIALSLLIPMVLSLLSALFADALVRRTRIKRKGDAI